MHVHTTAAKNSCFPPGGCPNPWYHSRRGLCIVHFFPDIGTPIVVADPRGI